jgi:uncharacterized NAD-dependent epimerase/dehydratase family protein
MQNAIVLANGHFTDFHGKTSHALVRRSERYRILAVIDPDHAGSDAGLLLDNRHRGIPVLESVKAALASLETRPEVCIVGVATGGGVLPAQLRRDLLEAASRGLDLVNGLHQSLADDPDLSAAARAGGARILDIRRPRPTAELRFWTGDVRNVPALRVPVLGTDCAVGKRTTCVMLRDACRGDGIRAEMVHTGQTGWLQGSPYGFLFDATPNDFVCGELEGAILRCHEDADPEVIFIEGQAALRNPSGPCGAELIVAGAASGVVLQHAPARRHFIDVTAYAHEIPPIEEELRLISLLGVEVWAVTLNEQGMDEERARETATRLRARLGLPVVLPLRDGVREIVERIRGRLPGGRA